AMTTSVQADDYDRLSRFGAPLHDYRYDRNRHHEPRYERRLAHRSERKQRAHRYAERAVVQAREARWLGYHFRHPRWSTNYRTHFRWALRADRQEIRREIRSRERQLSEIRQYAHNSAPRRHRGGRYYPNH
ncbi:MAG: hypothetical protein F6K31_23335, partial [Symploca sp. SIO2G7]|nr:hypothetical protein [Symploca sp. SIO2G7]